MAVKGYLDSTAPRIGGSVSVESYPLLLGLELTKSDLVVGENLTFRLTLTNLSNQSVQIEYPQRLYQSDYGLQRFGFVFLYENGTELVRRSGGGPTWGWNLVLSPNEVVSQEFHWDQRFMLEGDYNIRTPPPQVPAGVYMLKGCVPSGRDSIIVNGGDRIRIETPSITFRIGS